MPDGPEETAHGLGGLSRPRQIAYDFLATSFLRPPSLRELQLLRSIELRELGCCLCGPEFAHGLDDTPITPDEEQRTRQEFMDLFKVPGGKYIPLYESVFRDTRELDGQQVAGLLMGQSAVDVQKWYRLAAIEFTDDCKELPDHFGVELAYVAHLCGKEQEFVTSGDTARLVRAREMQRDFLAAHVCLWVDTLRDRVASRSKNPFYRAVCELVVALAHRDLETLESLLGSSSRSSAPSYPRGMP
jgi:TorA maturation chaperone TorD